MSIASDIESYIEELEDVPDGFDVDARLDELEAEAEEHFEDTYLPGKLAEWAEEALEEFKTETLPTQIGQALIGLAEEYGATIEA